MSLLFTLTLGHFFKKPIQTTPKLFESNPHVASWLISLDPRNNNKKKKRQVTKKIIQPISPPLLKRYFYLKKNVMSFNDFSPLFNVIFWHRKKKTEQKKHRSRNPLQVLAHGCIGSASVRVSKGDKGRCSAKNPRKKEVVWCVNPWNWGVV